VNLILSFNSNPQPEANAFLCAYPSQLAKDSINQQQYDKPIVSNNTKIMIFLITFNLSLIL
jgi:hypothetical protein